LLPEADGKHVTAQTNAACADRQMRQAQRKQEGSHTFETERGKKGDIYK
jgi:hypothetical protein